MAARETLAVAPENTPRPGPRISMEADLNAIKLSVSGMKCNGCIAKATAAVAKLPGYVAAEFDLKAGTAVVRGSVDPRAAINSLASAGYPASLKNR